MDINDLNEDQRQKITNLRLAEPLTESELEYLRNVSPFVMGRVKEDLWFGEDVISLMYDLFQDEKLYSEAGARDLIDTLKFANPTINKGDKVEDDGDEAFVCGYEVYKKDIEKYLETPSK